MAAVVQWLFMKPKVSNFWFHNQKAWGPVENLLLSAKDSSKLAGEDLQFAGSP